MAAGLAGGKFTSPTVLHQKEVARQPKVVFPKKMRLPGIFLTFPGTKRTIRHLTNAATKQPHAYAVKSLLDRVKCGSAAAVLRISETELNGHKI
jgi:hypothetical protein